MKEIFKAEMKINWLNFSQAGKNYYFYEYYYVLFNLMFVNILKRYLTFKKLKCTNIEFL